jgi:glycosyltransferase involved in cell wall biosynthesis
VFEFDFIRVDIVVQLPISAVVVVRNAENTLAQCLTAIKRNGPVEVIIVDGKSTDHTLNIARGFSTRIFVNENNGIGEGRQIGAENASQGLLAYIDSDVVLSDGALESMLGEMLHGQYDHVHARIASARTVSYWERAVDAHFNLNNARINGGLAAGILKRDLILKVKFDPAIRGAGEDLDFLWRWKMAGYTSYLSKTEVLHFHRTNLGSFLKQRYFYGRGKTALLKKHGIGKKELWVPAVTAYWIFVCLKKGKPGLIPYFVVDGIVETLGMIRGMF